jgi:hypothetical protein
MSTSSHQISHRKDMDHHFFWQLSGYRYFNETALSLRALRIVVLYSLEAAGNRTCMRRIVSSFYYYQVSWT